MLPKTESVEDLRELRHALERAGAREGVGMWCLIETPLGVLNAADIAEVGAEAFGLQALGVGTNDLSKELRCGAVPGRAPLLHALSTVVTAARAFGVSVLDGVYNNTRDTEGFLAEAQQARALGFDGKTLIHPGTVPLAHAAFAPTEAEVQWAQRVIDAVAAAASAGDGVTTVDGQLVEELHAEQARGVLAQAQST